MLFPVFVKARMVQQRTACMQRLRDQATDLQIYANSNDDRLPNANWMDAISPILAPDQNLKLLHRREMRDLHCPAVPRSNSGYAFNMALLSVAVKTVPNPSKTVLTFDSTDLQWNATATPSDAPQEGRHDGKNNFSFLDGHVKALPAPK